MRYVILVLLLIGSSQSFAAQISGPKAAELYDLLWTTAESSKQLARQSQLKVDQNGKKFEVFSVSDLRRTLACQYVDHPERPSYKCNTTSLKVQGGSLYFDPTACSKISHGTDTVFSCKDGKGRFSFYSDGCYKVAVGANTYMTCQINALN